MTTRLPFSRLASRCKMARVANAPSSFWTRRSTGRPSDVAQLLGEPGGCSPAHRLERIDVGEAVTEQQHVGGTIGSPRRSIRIQHSSKPHGFHREERGGFRQIEHSGSIAEATHFDTFDSVARRRHTRERDAAQHPPQFIRRWIRPPRAANACRSPDTVAPAERSRARPLPGSNTRTASRRRSSTKLVKEGFCGNAGCFVVATSQLFGMD